jgi:hypothetical protein
MPLFGAIRCKACSQTGPGNSINFGLRSTSMAGIPASDVSFVPKTGNLLRNHGDPKTAVPQNEEAVRIPFLFHVKIPVSRLTSQMQCA